MPKEEYKQAESRPSMMSSAEHAGIAEAGAVFTRRDVGKLSMDSSTITSYKKAVKAMKALPASDPRSWAYQAAIHGTTVTPTRTAWNSCQHQNHFFFSWHRMYLWYFERIVRKLADDPAWALPYWNYESTLQRKLPTAFRSPADATNALFTPNRGPGWNQGTASLSAAAVNPSGALAIVPFSGGFGFSRQMESTPHGAVHIALSGWMGFPETAAQDPIFWLHHCNIDRLWNKWLTLGQGRTDPLGNLAWRTTRFTFFDENGTRVQLSACDILRAQEQLNYVYEGEPPQVKLSCVPAPPAGPELAPAPQLAWQPSRAIQLAAAPGPVRYDLPLANAGELVRRMKADPQTQLALEFADIDVDRQPNCYYELYVGLPDSAMPRHDSVHFVGNVAIFGVHHGEHGSGQTGHGGHGGSHGGSTDHGGHEPNGDLDPVVPRDPLSFWFDIGQAVEATVKRGQGGDTVRLTFVPRASLRSSRPAAVTPNASIRIGRARIGVGAL